MDSLGTVQFGKKWHRSLWESVSGYSSPACLSLKSPVQLHMRIFLLEPVLAMVLFEGNVTEGGSRGLISMLR